jgi:hypothetical protein
MRQFARRDHVKLGAETVRNRGSDNDTASRNSVNQRRKQPQPLQVLGEGFTSGGTIAKNRGSSLLVNLSGRHRYPQGSRCQLKDGR